MNVEVSREQAAGLLGLADIKSNFTLEPIVGGANNRVYKVAVLRKSYLLKAYFKKHPDDQRDRVGAEYTFIDFAWKNGILEFVIPRLEGHRRVAIQF